MRGPGFLTPAPLVVVVMAERLNQEWLIVMQQHHSLSCPRGEAGLVPGGSEEAWSRVELLR